MTRAARVSSAPGMRRPVWGWKERSPQPEYRLGSCKEDKLGTKSVRARTNSPEVGNPSCGRGVKARFCLRGSDLPGSLGPGTRHSLLRSRPAPDKRLQLQAGERDGRWEPGWPSPRREHGQGAHPAPRHRPNALPSPYAPSPPAPWPRPGTTLRVCHHVRPRGAGGGTWGSPRCRLPSGRMSNRGPLGALEGGGSLQSGLRVPSACGVTTPTHRARALGPARSHD